MADSDVAESNRRRFWKIYHTIVAKDARGLQNYKDKIQLKFPGAKTTGSYGSEI